jgi:uncharacterized small protein (DUF1192 family)
MDPDDLLPKKTPSPLSLQEDLARFSIADLDERIRLLESEIERCRTAKKSKQASLSTAHGFFKR